MMDEAFASRAIELSAVDLSIAAGLVMVAGLVSFGLRLELEKRLALAAVRTVVQLLLVGYVLRFVFAIDTPWPLVAVVAVMLSVAAHAALARSSRTFKNLYFLAFFTLVLSALVTTYAVTGLVIAVEPWYQPRYMIPLLGMILGNGLTGISLCIDQLLTTLGEKRLEVEMHLAHGATRYEAARPALKAAVRNGMIPIINSMMVVGLVALPGMMTGQILAGADPLEAVKYQIVVMFMIAASTSTACMLIALLIYRRLFNSKHQLLADRIRKKKS